MDIRKATTYRPTVAVRGMMLLAAIGIMLSVVSCSADEETEKSNTQPTTLEVAAFTRDYNISELPETRALPPGFSVYEPAEATDIDIFLCQTGMVNSHDVVSNASGHWRSHIIIDAGSSHIIIDAGKQYYIYGYMPKNAATSAEVTVLDGSFANGAVLNLYGLSTVSQSDVGVIVGVKQGDSERKDITIVDDLRLGLFSFIGQKPSDGNFVYLLLDHLYSAIGLQMRINANYNTLRQIRLKSMQLLTNTASTMTAQVALRANATGSNPVESITWQPTAGESTSTIYTNAAGLALTTTYQDISTAMFASAMNGRLTLRCVYDVYDTAGNLIRADQQSDNLLPTLPSAAPGEKTVIRLTVNPTYLYMLSDPDLNNPTVSFEVM